jgi:hypothetical protein
VAIYNVTMRAGRTLRGSTPVYQARAIVTLAIEGKKMYFDRFDICEAYYLALSDCHGGQWSPEYARLCRLRKSFKPSPLLSVDTLSDNAREIYTRACARLLGLVTLEIDGTEFTLRPESAESVRALCASIRTKGKGRKFKPDTPGLNMTRRYPERATSTYDYVCQFEAMNYKIFGASEMKRWAPLNYNATTHYDPREPIVSEEPC